MSALPPLLLTYSAACEVLGYGRTKVYELVERGDMEAVLGLPLQAAYDGWAAYLRERAGG